MATSLRVEGLRICRGPSRKQKTVIEGLDLTIAAGERVVLAGPSGSGKSTLLRAIAGLLPISHGHILIDGVPVESMPPGKRGIGMVFQEAALLPHLSVRDNLSFGLLARGMRRPEAQKKAEDMAALLELESLLERRPAALSGGEQQRVALGRALLRERGIVLLDEPLSALDAPLRARLREEILRLQKATGVTLLQVTHDQQEAMAIGQRIGILAEGRLLQIDKPQQLYAQPDSRFVAQFVGNPGINLLPVRLTDGELVWHDIALPGNTAGHLSQAADAVDFLLGVRPEHLHLTDDPTMVPAWPVELRRQEHLGDRELWHLNGPGGERICVTRPAGAATLGDPLHLCIPTKRQLLFDARDGQRLFP